MTTAEASQLRGRLVCSNSQTFGTAGALAYSALTKKASEGGGSTHMGDDLTNSLKWWATYFTAAKPRKVPVGKQKRPLYIFTAGSCEPSLESPVGLEAGYGAAMFDPEDKSLQSFGGDIGDALLDLLSDGGTKTQIVGQAELIPCLATKEIWRKICKGRLIMFYIDNEAAKFALINGNSPTRDSAWLVQQFREREANLECYS